MSFRKGKGEGMVLTKKKRTGKVGAGANNALRSARPRERSTGPFFFVPPASLISSCRACGEYNTLRGNKPAVSVRLLAPGANFWRHPTKANNLLRRLP